MNTRAFLSFLLTVLTSITSASPADAQDTAGVGGVAGTVVGADRQPALAVTVCLVGTIRCALTDDRGGFRIADLRPGNYQLEVTPPGQPRITSSTIDVRAGRDSQVEVTLPKATDLQQTVTVTAPAFIAPDEIKTSGFAIQPAEIQASAGALQDVSRFLQSLPGVAIGTNDFRNDIIVRGGSPLENLFVVDNVEIPNINAFANFSSAGGTVSLLDAALIRDVTFLTGGYPAPYGNRISSVLQVTQREGARDAVRARATLGFAGAGGIAEGPLAGGRGSWIVSVRRSFLDLVTKDIGIGGVPVLYTFNGKAVVDINQRDRVWVINVSGIDRIRLGLTDQTPAADALRELDIRYQGWRSATGANWQRVFGARGVGLFGVSHSKARVTSTVKDLIRDGLPEETTPISDVIAAGPVVFREGSTEDETTLKYDLTTYVMGNKIQTGGSFKRFALNYNTASPLGSDSPFTLDRTLNAFSLQQVFQAYQTSGYVQTTIDATQRLNLTAGIRADQFRYTGETRVAPRAGASYRLAPHLLLRGSYGQFYQQPPFLFLAAFPANRNLRPQRADHFVGAMSYQPSESSRITVEVYRKNYRDYPVSSQFPSLSLANVGDTFNVRDVLFPMLSEGRGRATGVEISAERKPGGRWHGQANLALARARHAGLDGVLRPGSFDYPFLANVDGVSRWTDRWQASIRLSWLGGRPFTPFDAALSAQAGRGIFDLTQVNGARTSDYVRLDARVERRLSADGTRLLFFGIQNMTNRRNVAGYDWDRRTGLVRVQEQMGLFPILGLEWKIR